MSEADKMFEEMGMRRILNNDNTIIYRFKDDYRDNTIFFDKKLQRFHYTCGIFIFNDRATWEEMKANNEFTDKFDKHCSTYGHWDSFPNDIGMDLLQAINKKCEELGWI